MKTNCPAKIKTNLSPKIPAKGLISFVLVKFQEPPKQMLPCTKTTSFGYSPNNPLSHLSPLRPEIINKMMQFYLWCRS